jgi:hypothetical protein
MYLRLSQGAAVSHFKDVWCTRVPPNIKVFLWQLMGGKLPCSEQVAKRQGTSDGNCALCGVPEDCSHIFFRCSLARFMWAGARETLQCNWNPAGAGEFLAIPQGLSVQYHRLVWLPLLHNIGLSGTFEINLILKACSAKPADVLISIIGRCGITTRKTKYI